MSRIKNIQIIMVFICLVILVCGCEHTSSGSAFANSDINQIVKGKTTTSELMNILGTPYSKAPSAEGGEQWSYFCNRKSLQIVPVPYGAVATRKKQQTDLTVLINKDKVVVDYTFNEGPTEKITKVGIAGATFSMTNSITSTNSVR